MTFSALRTLLWIVVFVGSYCIIKSLQKKPKHARFCIIFSGLLCVLIYFLPFENVIKSFPTLEKAFSYVSEGDIELVIPGTEADLVISRKNNEDYITMIPKTEDGWKVSVGTDMKAVRMGIHEDITFVIYRYKDTDDYFISISYIDGRAADVSDNNESEFYCLHKTNEAQNTETFFYYANVYGLNDSYSFMVNDTEVSITNE